MSVILQLFWLGLLVVVALLVFNFVLSIIWILISGIIAGISWIIEQVYSYFKKH